jgi:hypothetical protein
MYSCVHLDLLTVDGMAKKKPSLYPFVSNMTALRRDLPAESHPSPSYSPQCKTTEHHHNHI